MIFCAASFGWSQTVETNANSCLSIVGTSIHNSCQQTVNVWWCVQNTKSIWHCDGPIGGGMDSIPPDKSHPIQMYETQGGGRVELFACYSPIYPVKQGSGHLCKQY